LSSKSALNERYFSNQEGENEDGNNVKSKSLDNLLKDGEVNKKSKQERF